MQITAASRFLLHLALVSIQVAFSGFEVLSRVVLDRGAGKFPFTFYRNGIAVLIMSISAMLSERKKMSVGLSDAFQIFGLGTLGVTMNQVLYLAGLSSTSAMFAAAVRNSIPVFTFLVALLLRKEKLSLRSNHGRAKFLGCALGVCGSVLLSLYKGPVVIHSSFSPPFHAEQKQAKHLKKQCVQIFSFVLFRIDSWTLGALCLIASCISFSIFLVLQESLVKRLSNTITFVGLCSFSSLLELPVLAAVFEPHWHKWTRIPTSEVVAIAYAGVVASGFVTAAQTWGVQKAGPIIVAAYQPLETVITSLLGLCFLRESLHLGSVLGAVVVITGLYMLIWGQEKERKQMQEQEQEQQEQEQEQHQEQQLQQQEQQQQQQMITGANKVHPLEEAELAESSKWKIYTVNEHLQQIEIVELG